MSEDDFRYEAVRDRLRKKPEPRKDASDPYDIREHTRDELEGAHERRPEIWNQVMERHGFLLYSAKQLNEIVGPMTKVQSSVDFLAIVAPDQLVPHTEGQWRNDLHNVTVPPSLRTTFTVVDLFSLFVTPEAFDEWFRERVMQHEARRAGLKLKKKEKSVVLPGARKGSRKKVVIARH